MTHISRATGIWMAPSRPRRIASVSEGAVSTPSACQSLCRVTTIFSRPGSGLPTLSKVRRPMMTGLPIVSALKRLRSVERRHGRPPARPITPFSAIATWMPIFKAIWRGPRSHRHLGADMRVGFVVLQPEILISEGEEICHGGIDPHRRQLLRHASELFARLLEMVGVKMRVAEREDEFTRLVAGNLRHHHGQQRIGADVEGHAEEDVAGTLVELAGKPPVGDIELEQAMARRQRHLVDERRVPSRDDKPTR